MKTCYVIGAGECSELKIDKKPEDVVIAADGGLKHLENNGIKPDIIIGDFDSLDYLPGGENVIRLKPEKDVTDMYAAVEEGLKLGCDSVRLFGATGGRFDHTLANIQLIASLAEKGVSALINDGGCVIMALHNGTLKFDSSKKGYISVFSHSDESKGIYIKGLKYPLENATLTNSFSLGVSNEFLGIESEITVEKGTLIIICS